MRPIALAVLVYVLSTLAASSEIAPRPGWVVMPTGYSYQQLIKRVIAAAGEVKLGVVTRASATVGARKVLDSDLRELKARERKGVVVVEFEASADVEKSHKYLSEKLEEAKAELEEVDAKWRELIDEVEEVEVRPRRADVRIDLFALAWFPYWELGIGEQVLSMPAFKVESA